MIMKSSLMYSMLAIMLIVVGCSPSHNEPNVPEKKVTFRYTLPDKWKDSKIAELNVEVKNKDTGVTKTFSLKGDKEMKVSLPGGIYDIGATAKISDVEFRAHLSDFSIKADTEITLDMYPVPHGSFVIRELFYSGATTTKGKKYLHCDYVILTNNSDKTLYADGLSFMGTGQNTKLASDEQYSKVLPAVVAEFIFTIPGSGKDVPVPPGGDIVLAMEAKNHTETSTQAADLSKHANFEWFEPNERFQLTDNPNVPNMKIDFKESQTITKLHVGGYKSYCLIRMPKPINEVMVQDTIMYKAPNPKVPARPYPKIPMEWILDGVELFDGPNIITKALPSAVDKSHTYVTEKYKGYVVTRKVDYIVGDRKVYADTNDSKRDFERDQASSLLSKR